jgi:HK97 family phage major capsid protein
MSTSTNSQGGYTVQTEVAREVLDALKAFGGMRSVSDVIQTTGVGDMNYPTSDGTAETGEIIGQNTTATGADVSFGVKTLTVYKFSSKIVAVPFELLQDSNVDIEAFVRNRLVTRLGRITNTYFTTGTGGSSQPNGVVTAATVGVTAANSTSQVTAITYGSLVDLVHSVDPAYRALGNTKFMMNDASVKVLRKIVDGQSRPIFVPGYEQNVPGGAPDTLLGVPIVVNQDVADDGRRRHLDPLRRLLVLHDPGRDGGGDVPLHRQRLHQARPSRLPRLDALGRQPDRRRRGREVLRQRRFLTALAASRWARRLPPQTKEHRP